MTERATASSTGLIQPSLGKRLFWDVFAIDVRSLAALRICLGIMILVDLGNRVSQLELFYTGQGILTGPMSQQYLGEGFWSLYWIDDSVLVTQMLFAVTASAAVALIVGFNTKLMTILCLVLVASLQIRNPLVLTGGHILLRLMLFWSMFLPLGAVWSLDLYLSRYREPARWRLASVATVAIMLQVAFVYFFSGIAKLNEVWFSGQAVEQVLNLELYVKPAGEMLRNYPGLLKAISVCTVLLEVIAPVLMFVPGINKFVRGMAMALFWAMHLAIWATMSIGIFSLMAMVAWLVFVPTEFWNMFLRHHPDTEHDMHWRDTLFELAAQVVCGLALALTLALNIANINPSRSERWFPEFLSTLANRTLLIQEFKLFGHPPRLSPSFAYPSRLIDGSDVDLYVGMYRPADFTPSGAYDFFGSQHWRRLHSNLFTEPDQPSELIVSIRQRLLDKMVERWNETNIPGLAVAEAKLVCGVREIRLEGDLEPPREDVWAVWPHD